MTSAPANAARGETAVSVGGSTFVVRPSFEALVAAEEELGSLFALVERASSGELKLSEMTSLIWHCLELQDRPSREEVGAALLATGLISATQPVRAILAQVLKGLT